MSNWQSRWKNHCRACVDQTYKRPKYTWWYTLNNIELAGFWIRALDDNLPFKLRPHYHYCPHANNMFQVHIQHWVITHARTTYIATHVYKFIQVHSSSCKFQHWVITHVNNMSQHSSQRIIFWLLFVTIYSPQRPHVKYKVIHSYANHTIAKLFQWWRSKTKVEMSRQEVRDKQGNLKSGIRNKEEHILL